MQDHLHSPDQLQPAAYAEQVMTAIIKLSIELTINIKSLHLMNRENKGKATDD